MRKPSWDDAPEWAQWLAQDGDGAWWWCEAEPKAAHTIEEWITASRVAEASYAHNWRETLEERPHE